MKTYRMYKVRIRNSEQRTVRYEIVEAISKMHARNIVLRCIKHDEYIQQVETTSTWCCLEIVMMIIMLIATLMFMFVLIFSLEGILVLI